MRLRSATTTYDLSGGMGKVTTVMEGKYIYCIIETKGKEERFGPLGIGVRGDELYTICFDNIAAVVSDAPIKKYSVARENLIPHEKAVE
jgi:hypothetical protein